MIYGKLVDYKNLPDLPYVPREDPGRYYLGMPHAKFVAKVLKYTQTTYGLTTDPLRFGTNGTRQMLVGAVAVAGERLKPAPGGWRYIMGFRKTNDCRERMRFYWGLVTDNGKDCVLTGYFSCPHQFTGALRDADPHSFIGGMVDRTFMQLQKVPKQFKLIKTANLAPVDVSHLLLEAHRRTLISSKVMTELLTMYREQGAAKTTLDFVFEVHRYICLRPVQLQMDRMAAFDRLLGAHLTGPNYRGVTNEEKKIGTNGGA